MPPKTSPRSVPGPRLGPVLGLFLTASLAHLPLGASAQHDDTVVEADLDGDGQSERFEVRWTASGDMRLTIRADGDTQHFYDIAWVGGAWGQQPTLSLASSGSVLLHSTNEGVGRNRWYQTLTIAWRDGGYRVVGFTYSWLDTLDLNESGHCDLNLLTGRGVLKTEGSQTEIAADYGALPLADWSSDTFPEACIYW